MMNRLLQGLLLTLLLATPPAFAKRAQMAVAADQSPKPAEGKAMVVFFRDSFVAAAIAASVYEAPDGKTTFFGIVRNKQKIAAQVEPGQHRFMVVAENADFLDADLQAGKTYYVLISPRPGWKTARFSLFPIHERSPDEYNVESRQFKAWTTKTEYVDITPEALAWYDDNTSDIESKKSEYLQKWNRMSPADRAELVLHPQDGLATPK